MLGSYSIQFTRVSLYCLLYTYSLFAFEGQLSGQLRDNTFSWVLSLLGRYFYIMYVVKMFEIVFSCNVKYNNIFPGLHNIKLSYNM